MLARNIGIIETLNTDTKYQTTNTTKDLGTRQQYHLPVLKMSLSRSTGLFR